MFESLEAMMYRSGMFESLAPTLKCGEKMLVTCGEVAKRCAVSMSSDGVVGGLKIRRFCEKVSAGRKG